MNPYEDLANAIVIQAVKDYRQALRFLKHHPHTPDIDTEEAKANKHKRVLRNKILEHECERDDIERFFRSGWYKALTSVDGEYLIQKLREEAKPL